MENIWWAAAAFYSLAVVSAVHPCVNAEIVMLSAVPFAKSPEALGLLVVMVTVGQMTGKGVMFWLARLGKGRRSGRLTALAEPWMSERPHSALGVVLVSSTFRRWAPLYLRAGVNHQQLHLSSQARCGGQIALNGVAAAT